MPAIPASELCFLSGLPAKTAGQKVRFLGCVTSYDTAAGILTLQHQYQHPPATGAGTGTPVPICARVNVDLVLERLTAEQMSVGAWVNVMGYVTAVAAAPAGTTTDRNAAVVSDVHVQALLLWSTGPLDVQAYERHLGAMLSIGTGT